MEEQNTLATLAPTHSSAFAKPTASLAKVVATKNQILAALPDADFARLRPNLEPISLPTGVTLRDARVRATEVYFLNSGIACQLHIANGGAKTALALIGRESMVGIESFLGGESLPMRSVMLSEGHGYRINAQVLIDEFYRSPSMRRIFLRYAQALLTQIQQTAVCSGHHSVEKRLARFLLLCLDRLPANEITMTQAQMGTLLGVRRESVTEAARKLLQVHAINYVRGHITVVDRVALEAYCCECYAVVKWEYDRLAPEAIFQQASEQVPCVSDGSSASQISTAISKEFG